MTRPPVETSQPAVTPTRIPRLAVVRARGVPAFAPARCQAVDMLRGATATGARPSLPAVGQAVGPHAALLRTAVHDPVSLAPMHMPYVLADCGHSFARESLVALFAAAPEGCRCPVCRTPVVSDSQPNYVLREVVEVLAAVGVLDAGSTPYALRARALRAPRQRATNGAGYRAHLLGLRLALGDAETHVCSAVVLINAIVCFGLAEGRPRGNQLCTALLVVSLVALPALHWVARRRLPTLPPAS